MENEAIIVGAGICGLIIARELLHAGVRVLILEANDEVGGQICDLSFDDKRAASVRLGAAYLDPQLHYDIQSELKRYDIGLLRRNYPFTFVKHKEVENVIDYLSSVHSNPGYIKAIATLNKDSRLLDYFHGFHHLEREYLDVAMSEYILTRLNIAPNDTLYDFLAWSIWSLVGAMLDEVSALHVLYVFSSFRDAEKALFFPWPLGTSISAGDYRSGHGLSLLINAIRDDVLALGGQIMVNQAVTSIIAQVNQQQTYQAISDYKAESVRLMHQRVDVYATDTTKGSLIPREQMFTCRMVIVTVPLHCAASIHYSPPLPETLQSAMERCAVSSRHHTASIAVLATGISRRVDRIINLSSDGLFMESIVHQRLAADEENEEDEGEGRISQADKACVVSLTARRSTVITSSSSNQEALLRALHEAHPDLTILENNPSNVHVQDWGGNRWSRGGRFHLHPGTAELLSTASEQALQPWTDSNGISIGGLCIASSAFAKEWPGWIEGAIIHAKRLTKENIIPVVNPPRIARNFARKAVPYLNQGGSGSMLGSSNSSVNTSWS